MPWLRMLVVGILIAMAGAPVASCGGSSVPEASEPGEHGGTAAGDGEETADGPDPDCCCQRYDEDGDPTGAVISDASACKSTGGNCTDDRSQCESD